MEYKTVFEIPIEDGLDNVIKQLKIQLGHEGRDIMLVQQYEGLDKVFWNIYVEGIQLKSGRISKSRSRYTFEQAALRPPVQATDKRAGLETKQSEIINRLKADIKELNSEVLLTRIARDVESDKEIKQLKKENDQLTNEVEQLETTIMSERFTTKEGGKLEETKERKLVSSCIAEGNLIVCFDDNTIWLKGQHKEWQQLPEVPKS